MYHVLLICENKFYLILHLHNLLSDKKNIRTVMEVTTNTQRKGLPRSLQFQRMERIVKAMQHPTAGVPVRSQKLFLTTVPNAFTGNDVTEWIMQKLGVKDSGTFHCIVLRHV